MKTKKILIVYNSIGNGFAKKESLFNELINELVSEGRTVSHYLQATKNKSVTFKDGSKIMAVPFATGLIGIRVTHLYVDDSIYNLQNGEQYVNEALKPTVIRSDNYQNMYAEGSQEDRTFIYWLVRWAV